MPNTKLRYALGVYAVDTASCQSVSQSGTRISLRPQRLPSAANDLVPEKCTGQRHAGVRGDVIKSGGSRSSTPGRVGRISISGITADNEDVGRWNITTESDDVAE